ncbi:unnamed protein product [Sphagnum compactum]
MAVVVALNKRAGKRSARDCSCCWGVGVCAAEEEEEEEEKGSGKLNKRIRCRDQTVDKYGGGRSSSEQLGYGPVQGPGTRLCIEVELGEAEEIPRAAEDVFTSDEDDDAGGGAAA